MSPRDVADKVVAKVPKNELIEKLGVAGPGFVNIDMSKDFVDAQIKGILKLGIRAPLLSEDPKSKKVRIFIFCFVPHHNAHKGCLKNIATDKSPFYDHFYSVFFC